MKSETQKCEARDDHASAFDPKSKLLYVFGGYVNGDKSNDMWSYDLVNDSWKCLHSGDYKKDIAKQNPKNIPSPRVGARMVQIDDKTIYIHNGHDNDNEKISDIWKFDIDTNQWSEIEQKGDVPKGRNGHSIHLHDGFLVMFGGILGITEESDDIYLF